MRLWRYTIGGTFLLSGCGENAPSLAVMGVVALVTGWAISASLRSRDPKDDAKDVEGAAALFPRFQTPAWLEESQVLLRVFGATEKDVATNEKTVQGLPFPVGFVVDIDDMVVRFNDLHLDGVEHSVEELFARALDNLRASQPALEIPTKGETHAVRDDKGHAAARALLIPDLLNEEDSVYVAAPTRELLLVMADKSAMRKARVTFEEATREAKDEGNEDAPIPAPLRVTAKGFKAAKWP
ncbi:MAG: hypothetical protein AB8H86_27760 [Polyangiales bacterium]